MELRKVYDEFNIRMDELEKKIGSGGGGSEVSVTQVLTEGEKIATITVGETSTDLFAPSGSETVTKANITYCGEVEADGDSDMVETGKVYAICLLLQAASADIANISLGSESMLLCRKDIAVDANHSAVVFFISASAPGYTINDLPSLGSGKNSEVVIELPIVYSKIPQNPDLISYQSVKDGSGAYTSDSTLNKDVMIGICIDGPNWDQSELFISDPDASACHALITQITKAYANCKPKSAGIKTGHIKVTQTYAQGFILAFDQQM